MDKSSVIFNNPMPKKVVKSAEKSKAKYIKKYGDDSKADFLHLHSASPIRCHRKEIF